MHDIMSGLSENQRLLVVAIIGFIVGVAVTAALFLAKGGVPDIATTNTKEITQPATVVEGATKEEVSSSAAPVTGVSARVDVLDQGAGSIVRLQSVSVANSSWVAVHEDIAGVPGNVLGAVRFNQGSSAGQVTLVRPTLPGQLYYVRLYRDNGDREFDLSTDNLVVNAAGVPIQDVFQTASGN